MATKWSRCIKFLISCSVVMSVTRSFVFCFFLYLSVKIISSELCGSCFYKENIAICYINGCTSILPRSPQVDIIQVYGKLCSNHIHMFKDIFYHNTMVELFEDTCPVDMSNCRWVF